MTTMPQITDHIDSDDLLRIRETLDTLRAHLSKIHHDVNNPMTVLSGNTELMRELAKAMGVVDDFEGPLADMESALDVLSERIDALMVVRKILTDVSDSIQ